MYLAWVAMQGGSEPQELACEQRVEIVFESEVKVHPEPNGWDHISTCVNHDSLDSVIEQTSEFKVSCVYHDSI